MGDAFKAMFTSIRPVWGCLADFAHSPHTRRALRLRSKGLSRNRRILSEIVNAADGPRFQRQQPKPRADHWMKTFGLFGFSTFSFALHSVITWCSRAACRCPRATRSSADSPRRWISTKISVRLRRTPPAWNEDPVTPISVRGPGAGSSDGPLFETKRFVFTPAPTPSSFGRANAFGRRVFSLLRSYFRRPPGVPRGQVPLPLA